ncbi:MAG: hypothetical protein GY796_08810 [Chloroflexi bacterium]|nr:hypothetical protein [Chloroflexota bacterium]
MRLNLNWQRPNTGIIIGSILLILFAMLVPSATLVNWLRSSTVGLWNELTLGMTFFRLGLIILGILVLLLAGLAIWEKPVAAKQDTAAASSTISIYSILALGLAVVSLLIRLYQLGNGLWYDEILTYMMYMDLPFGDLISTYNSENQHFLFSILARASFYIFGPSAWALRLPAALFGVGSILALHLFGRYVADEREGFLAAALLAFSYHHVWFSQNARGYSGLLFWTILSSWLLLKALDKSCTKLWLLYALTAALGMYTHMTMMFVIFSHGVIYLVTLFRRRKQTWEQWWYGGIGLGLAGFFVYLFYSPVLPQLLPTMSATESVVAEWRNPLWTLVELVKGIMLNFSGGTAVIGGLVGLVALILFGTGVVSYARSNLNVLLLLFVPSVVGASLTVSLGHHLWPRFFFFTFGFGALVVVRGVLHLGDWLGRLAKLPPQKASWVGVGLCVGMILVSAVSVIFAFGPKQDYDAALAYLETNAQPGDAIVTVALTANVYQNFYGRDWPEAKTAAELEQIRTQAHDTWIVYTFKPVANALNPGVLESANETFQAMERFPGSVGAGTIFIDKADGE